ncbi:MAG: hypothetical protein K8F62_14735 [Pseudorhodoplanes sp.]|nr:hypothetical protein [Pseudorhodoplanes sp.]
MHDYSDRVVGYGADDRPSGFYAVFSMGVLIALAAIFNLIGNVGGSHTEYANNPSETKVTTGQATTERSEGPSTQSPDAQRR